ncbi:YitT family ABC transporter [Spiroplasma tabanidicola]|uniref:YitT family protein n=1 Tax=Spiroplasma tabanidicola TaxID=324079 RepID=A0A6I6C8U1_9MOLU|nr:YitT family ABC transporter [Spiroplasma tabanidicola]QGS51879.1 YitT family protein [Spiroplasma tabanidicola]
MKQTQLEEEFLDKQITTDASQIQNLDNKTDNTKDIDVSHFESKILSKREQILLVQNYFRNKFWKDLLKLMLSSLISTIAFDYFISITGRAGLFPAGIGAFARFLSILTFGNDVSKQSSFYFIYYFVINIPLFVFGYIKLGKKFCFTTILFILFQITFDQILQKIPFINPTDFHFIVNYKLLQQIGNSWNAGIWLFVFGVIGGSMLGLSYSIVYKMGSSTGGADFISIYVSKKKNKPIGAINRNVNLVILGVVITLNSIILPVNMINSDNIVNILKNLGLDNAFKTKDKNDVDIVNSILSYLFNKEGLIDVNGIINPDFAQKMGIKNGVVDTQASANNYLSIIEEIINNLKGQGDITNFDRDYAWQYLIEYAAKNGYGNVLPFSLVSKIKLGFILGPSLFASIGLVLSAAFTTNALYPKFKVRTYMIKTNNPKEINKTLLDNGYQNDIINWDVTNRINRNYLHRAVVMVAMTVLNWDEIEKQIFLADPNVKINILQTKAIKGIFDYDIKKNDERDFILKKITSDEQELEKIRQIALVKYNKEQKKGKKKKTTKITKKSCTKKTKKI